MIHAHYTRNRATPIPGFRARRWKQYGAQCCVVNVFVQKAGYPTWKKGGFDEPSCPVCVAVTKELTVVWSERERRARHVRNLVRGYR